MLKFLRKIYHTPRVLVPESTFRTSDNEISTTGKALEEKVRKLFGGSLAIRQIAAGSDNSVEQEMNALTNPYYDVERFGIHFVASPKHADMLMVAGPVALNMKEALIRAYNVTPDPKIVVAVGDGAIDGGVYKGSYAIAGAVRDVIPVDYEIAGDPPSPETMIRALLSILEKVETKKTTQ
jgi:Ni,Fe-hydrogenase III small subunit